MAKISEDAPLRAENFEDFIRYGQKLTTELDHFLKSEESKAYAPEVRSRFVNFSDEGSAIQEAFNEYDRDEILDALEEGQENGRYVRLQFEEFEGYLSAVTENIEEMLDAFDIPQEAREPVYKGLGVMMNHYDPR